MSKSDKSGWECTWTNRTWVHCDGMVISRHWSLIPGVAENYYFCFLTKTDFDAGNNFATRSTLREAKETCRHYISSAP